MSTPPTRSRFPWQTLVIVGLTVGLLWLFVRNIDLDETWRAMIHADPWILSAAVLVVLLTYVIRAQRWLILLKPLGHARFRQAFRTTVIGFAANLLLPGRVGEVLRPYLLARAEDMNPASAFATIIVERLLDMAMVIMMFALALPVSGIDLGPQANVIKISGLVLAGVALLGLATLFVLAGRPERLGAWASRLGRRLPPKAAQTVGHLAQRFAEGLQVMRSPGHFLSAVIWSVALWLSISMGVWLTSHALGLNFSYVGSFLVLGFLAVGVAVPTPGGAGGFHEMYKIALTQLFNANENTAVAAGFILHAVSFVPVTILGLVFMWQDGLSLGRLKQMKSGAQAAERTGDGPVAGSTTGSR